jgi:hypothetical protein
MTCSSDEAGIWSELDIGDSSIKVVELKDLGERPGFPVGEDRVGIALGGGDRRRRIMDSQLVIETIQRLFQRLKIKNTQVATALSGHSVIVKRISLPVMTAAELAESIHWEAEQYIPFDIDDVNLDYQILEGSSCPGEGNMDVLLAAAKKGQDQRLHQRDHAGRACSPSRSTSRPSRCKTPSKPTTSSSRTRSSPSWTSAPPVSSDHRPPRRHVGLLARHQRRRQPVHRRDPERSSTSPASRPKSSKRGDELDGIPYERSCRSCPP